MSESTTSQTTTESATPRMTTEFAKTPITTHSKTTIESTVTESIKSKTDDITSSTITTGLSGSYGEKKSENKAVVVTVGIVGSVIGVLLVISVMTIITLKCRKRNYDLEDDRPQDKDAYSDVPNWVKFFNNKRPTLYQGSWTSYQPKSFPILENLTYVQSESNGRDESMFNYRV
jgi:beta-lactamase regulating signal transducer with metallopeptidase domain